MARLTIIKNKGTKYTIGADVLVNINSGQTMGTPVNVGGANTSPVYFSNGKPIAVTTIDGGSGG